MGLERVTEAGNAVFAGVVQIEGELDQRRALFINDDGVDEPALELDRRVLVADRRGEWSAAVEVLLHLSLADLGSKVRVLVLSEGGKDPVVELAGWRGVDVLQYRNELCASLSEPIVNHRVVHRITREAVELMHDGKVDVALTLDVSHHLHELWAVLRLGGLGKIDILAHNNRTQFGDLALAGFSLGRNAIALVTKAALDLLVA